MTDLETRTEICQVFASPMGLTNDEIKNGDLSESPGAGSRSLCIPAVKDSFEWTKKVASLPKAGGFIYLIAKDFLPGTSTIASRPVHLPPLNCRPPHPVHLPPLNGRPPHPVHLPPLNGRPPHPVHLPPLNGRPLHPVHLPPLNDHPPHLVHLPQLNCRPPHPVHLPPLNLRTYQLDKYSRYQLNQIIVSVICI